MTRSPFHVCIGLSLLLFCSTSSAEIDASDVESLREQVRQLTERLEELENSGRTSPAQPGNLRTVGNGGGSWTERLSISGNTDIAYFNGASNSLAPAGRMAVENARLFFDIDLTDYDAEGGAAESTSFFFEWDMLREGATRNQFGSVYLQFEHLFEKDWLNVRVGRMPVPFGVEYERFHQARPSSPFLSFSVTAPYNWDQGVSLYGSVLESRVEYVIAALNGDSGFENTHSEPTIVTKLTVRPTPWMAITTSGLRTGTLGGGEDPGRAAFEFSGVHPTPFGGRSSVQSYANGGPVDDDPASRVDVTAWEADVTLSSETLGQLWLSYGTYDIESSGASTFDRDLRYWVVEGVLELGGVADWAGWTGPSEMLDPWYLAVRHSAVGTFDSDEGYLLGFMNEGDNLGFNTERVVANSLGLGYRLNHWATLKLEYTHFEVDLIRGVPADIRALTGSRDYMALGISAGF